MTADYRALWLSDVHLGTSAARARDLLDFLELVSADVIYLAGDIIDLQRLKVRPWFPADHRRVAARLLQLARSGTRVVYIPGNHDADFRRLLGGTFFGIHLEPEVEHICADGRSLLVVHGDCLDRFVRRGHRLERFGAAAYGWLVDADARLGALRRRFGTDYSSFSTAIKLRLKSVNDYIRRFEEAAARYAEDRGFDGIVCGHIHRPCIREIGGIFYANDGDWVEHGTALAEAGDGRLLLLRWSGETVDIAPALQHPSIAA